MTEKKEFPFTLKIRDKEINYRKWKVKDKKKFITALENNDGISAEAVVYDCLENPNIPLTEEEYRWVIMNIRAKSIGETLKFDIGCDECGQYFEYNESIFDAQVPQFKAFGTIRSGSVSLKMGEIPNKEYYDDAIRQCNNSEEKFFIDFLFHVKEMNGSDAFSFDTLYNFVNNLDIDVGEDLFQQWNDMKLTFNNVHDVECPSCKHQQPIRFDELFGFFPDSWFR